MPTPTRLQRQRVNTSRPARVRRSGERLQPQEPIFYGSNRREERRHWGAFMAQQREQEAEMLAQAPRWARAQVANQQRIQRAEQALGTRRLKALRQRLEAGAARAALGRAEQRLARLYDAEQCMEIDRRMLANAY